MMKSFIRISPSTLSSSQFHRHFKKRLETLTWRVGTLPVSFLFYFFCTKMVDIQSQHQQPTGTFKAYSWHHFWNRWATSSDETDKLVRYLSSLRHTNTHCSIECVFVFISLCLVFLFFFTIFLLERIEKGGEPKQDPPDWLNILISLVDCMLIQHNQCHSSVFIYNGCI